MYNNIKIFHKKQNMYNYKCHYIRIKMTKNSVNKNGMDKSWFQFKKKDGIKMIYSKSMSQTFFLFKV